MFKAMILTESGATHYTDRALFEVDAKERIKRNGTRGDARAFYRGEVAGQNRALVQAASGTWKMPGRKKWQERTGLDVGAEVLVFRGDYDQNPTRGQVWSLAPRKSVWVVLDGGEAIRVDVQTGSAYSAEMGHALNLRVRPAAEVE